MLKRMLLGLPILVSFGTYASEMNSGRGPANAGNAELKIVSCPGATYQCAGVDRSVDNASALFDLHDADSMPPNTQMMNLTIGKASVAPFQLKNDKTSVCEGQTVPQPWNLIKAGKYFKFTLQSKCGNEQHSIEAFCQDIHRICVDR